MVARGGASEPTASDAQPLVASRENGRAPEGRRNELQRFPSPLQGFITFVLRFQGFRSLRSPHPWLPSAAPPGLTPNSFLTPVPCLLTPSTYCPFARNDTPCRGVGPTWQSWSKPKPFT